MFKFKYCRNIEKSKFTETQINGAIYAYEAGKDVQQICQGLKFNGATFYNWKKIYSCMDSELPRQFKEIQRGNMELKSMYADLSLDNSLLRKVIEKCFKALSKARHCRGTGD